jgi:hypothetical protein
VKKLLHEAKTPALEEEMADIAEWGHKYGWYECMVSSEHSHPLK